MIICPICLNNSFRQEKVLQKRLIEEWELSFNEVNYIDKQQGLYCKGCSCNLRSMTLAAGIMRHFSFKGSFKQFIYSRYFRKLRLLEVNEAGELHTLLVKFKNHVFAEYPLVDLQNLPYSENSFDLIIHSDTLEHVENTARALKECYRVIKRGGVLFYTIPIIYGRMTKRRDLLSNSYHGSQDETQGEDFKVWTEYGADFWVETINAGFKEITLNTLEDHSSIAICAQKIEDYRNNYIHVPSLVVRNYKMMKKILKQLIS